MLCGRSSHCLVGAECPDIGGLVGRPGPQCLQQRNGGWLQVGSVVADFGEMEPDTTEMASELPWQSNHEGILRMCVVSCGGKWHSGDVLRCGFRSDDVMTF